MNFLDYVILAALAACIVGAVIFIRRRKKQGGCSGCSGCCSGCAQSKKCGDDKDVKK